MLTLVPLELTMLVRYDDEPELSNESSGEQHDKHYALPDQCKLETSNVSIRLCSLIEEMNQSMGVQMPNRMNRPV